MYLVRAELSLTVFATGNVGQLDVVAKALAGCYGAYVNTDGTMVHISLISAKL